MAKLADAPALGAGGGNPLEVQVLSSPQSNMMSKKSPFGEGKNWKLNACVGNNGGPYNYFDYACGYFQAGDALAERLIQNSGFDMSMQIDATIYPLLYLYRQGLELILKHFVNIDNVNASHDLTKLWSSCETQVKDLLQNSYNKSDYTSSLKSIESFILKMQELDPSSMVSRFPEDKNKNNFLSDYSIINIEPIYVSARDFFGVMSYLVYSEQN